MATTFESQTFESLVTPPGNSSTPYTLPALEGEIIYIPFSKSATRLLVTGKETDGAFAVVGSGGTHGDPIGFHFHREAHDVFLCLKGAVNVWADDKCRTMTPGDFASVPPGVVHQYQIVGPYTEFLGLIVPGGWEEFFRFLGEPYTQGPMFPLSDGRNFFTHFLPILKQAAEKFDMVPQPQKKSFAPQEWDVENDNKLPGKKEAYFLKSSTGPKLLVGGAILRPLATKNESDSKFEIASIEGSQWHLAKGWLFDEQSRGLTFETTHHCLQVSDGYIDFTVKGVKSRLGQGETIYIPAHTEFKFEFASRFAKAYVFSNGNGLVELLSRLGDHHGENVIPEAEETIDMRKLESLQEELGFRFV